jgi:hypothetical protein
VSCPKIYILYPYFTLMGEMRNAYKILIERPEGKRSLERPRRGLEDNINMDLTKRVGRCKLDSYGSG